MSVKNTDVLLLSSSRQKVQPIDIHKRLVTVYDGETVDVSMVRRWVCHFQSGDRDVSNKPCSGCAWA